MADKQIKDFTAKTQLVATDQFILQESGGVTKKCVATVLNDISYTGGGQIKFPATQNPSSNANTLDDYEEGVFTPVAEGEGTVGTGTYQTRLGNYTKIGNLVFFNVYLQWTTHTGTGNLTIRGLPFQSSAGAACSVILNNFTATGDWVSGYLPYNTIDVYVLLQSSDSAVSRLQIKSNAYIYISGYFITT